MKHQYVMHSTPDGRYELYESGDSEAQFSASTPAELVNIFKAAWERVAVPGDTWDITRYCSELGCRRHAPMRSESGLCLHHLRLRNAATMTCDWPRCRRVRDLSPSPDPFAPELDGRLLCPVHLEEARVNIERCQRLGVQVPCPRSPNPLPEWQF